MMYIYVISKTRKYYDVLIISSAFQWKEAKLKLKKSNIQFLFLVFCL